jgi:hypothetical protein
LKLDYSDKDHLGECGSVLKITTLPPYMDGTVNRYGGHSSDHIYYCGNCKELFLKPHDYQVYSEEQLENQKIQSLLNQADDINQLVSNRDFEERKFNDHQDQVYSKIDELEKQIYELRESLQDPMTLIRTRLME